MAEKKYSQDPEVQKLCEEFIENGGKITFFPTGFVPGYNGMWKIPSYVVRNGKATHH